MYRVRAGTPFYPVLQAVSTGDLTISKGGYRNFEQKKKQMKQWKQFSTNKGIGRKIKAERTYAWHVTAQKSATTVPPRPARATKGANNVLTGNTARCDPRKIKEARKTSKGPRTNASVQKQIMAIECIRCRQYRTGRWQKGR